MKRCDRQPVARICKSFLIPMCLLFLAFPAHLFFYLSLPSINSFVRHVYEDEPMLGPHESSKWCGCYFVRINDVGPNGVDATLNGAGVYYEPEHLPNSGMFPPPSGPLGGHWFRYVDYGSWPGLFPIVW